MLLRSLRRTSGQLHSLQQIPTQHDMLPQHLVYKNELNREYVITLARKRRNSLMIIRKDRNMSEWF